MFSSSEDIDRHQRGQTGLAWNSGAFISGPEVDDGEIFIHDEDVYDYKIDFMDTSDTRHHTDMSVSLIDIARPAKRKGNGFILYL